MTETKRAINLLRGYPNPTLLPVEQLNEATNRLLGNRDLAEKSLLYGPDAGWPPLIQALSKWQASFYGPAISQYKDRQPDAKSEEGIPPARLVTTCGASQSLAVILNVLTDPIYTRKIWIVAPAYFLAFRMFEDAGFQGRMRGVPEHASGPDTGADVDWLRRELKKDSSKFEQQINGSERKNQTFKSGSMFPKLYRHVIYVVPTYANPSSVTTSLSVREELVACAREFDALIVCDDVYDMLQWQTLDSASSDSLKKARLPRVVDVDRYLAGGADRPGADGYGNVISNGSFSKICGPGCRLGWAESTPKTAQLLAESGTSKSGDTASVFMSAVLADLLETGALDNHVFKKLQPAYASRQRKLMNAIETYLFPLDVRVNTNDRRDDALIGGYFIWLTLPSSLDADEVARNASQWEQLTVGRGAQFEIPDDSEGQKFRNSLRLSFAWEDEEMLTEGVKRLAAVVQSMTRQTEKSAIVDL